MQSWGEKRGGNIELMAEDKKVDKKEGNKGSRGDQGKRSEEKKFLNEHKKLLTSSFEKKNLESLFLKKKKKFSRRFQFWFMINELSKYQQILLSHV